jgi:transposase-like protein
MGRRKKTMISIPKKCPNCKSERIGHIDGPYVEGWYCKDCDYSKTKSK